MSMAAANASTSGGDSEPDAGKAVCRNDHGSNVGDDGALSLSLTLRSSPSHQAGSNDISHYHDEDRDNNDDCQDDNDIKMGQGEGMDIGGGFKTVNVNVEGNSSLTNPKDGSAAAVAVNKIDKAQQHPHKIQFSIGKKKRKSSSSDAIVAAAAATSKLVTNIDGHGNANVNLNGHRYAAAASAAGSVSLSHKRQAVGRVIGMRHGTNILEASESESALEGNNVGAASCLTHGTSTGASGDPVATGKTIRDTVGTEGRDDHQNPNSRHLHQHQNSYMNHEPDPNASIAIVANTSNHEHGRNNHPNVANHSNAHQSHRIINSAERSTSSSPSSNAIPIHATASVQQPDGWRVKLYRLNADGSWDDCGTGRITCLTSSQPREADYPHTPQQQRIQNPISHCNGGTAANTASNMNVSSFTDNCKNDPTKKQYNHEKDSAPTATVKQQWSNLNDEIYEELGEPTLCMHAEIPATNSQLQHLAALTTAVANKPPKLLLRTRVLLRESYQRQGDNIITWCETSRDGQPQQRQQQHGGRGREGNDHEDHHHVDEGVDDTGAGVDLALSFQDNAGCREIWNKISRIQHNAHALFEARGAINTDRGDSGISYIARHNHHQTQPHHNGNQHGEDDRSRNTIEEREKRMNDGDNRSLLHSNNNRRSKASTQMGMHHSSLSSNDNHRNLWGNSSDATHPHSNPVIDGIDVDEHDIMEMDAAAVSMAAQAAQQYIGGGQMISAHGKNQGIHPGDAMEIGANYPSVNMQLSNPPSLDNLEKIADVIAASQPQQREAIAMFVSQSECAYLKALLALFPAAEAENNYHALATLASVIKSIFLFNEPSMIQLVASDGQIFEDCCCCLEYDPDLKEKANHRWFIRDRLKFRTVLLMEDEELIESIHKAFRVTYIRDTLLRPTMDESSLSTLGSLLTFTHADVVKGVMCAPRNKHDAKSQDSYLVQILRLLGKEIRAIREFEWETMCQKGRTPSSRTKSAAMAQTTATHQLQSAPWKQHLTLQDDSLLSRKLRRRGCLSFLREMFNMVRMSLQQSDKDDFYAVIVLLDVDINEGPKQDTKLRDSDMSDKAGGAEDTVNLLSLLGAILSDTNADISERGACLDILSAIAMHEPSLIRKHCLVEFSSSKSEGDKHQKLGAHFMAVARPKPNENRQVVFACPPTDLFLSLLYVMATENDAGILLQATEVIRIILDTEMVNETAQLDLGGVIDNEEDELIGSENVSLLLGSNPSNAHSSGGCEQNSFLQMFYDHYVPWLVTPFLYSILVPKTAVPFSFKSGFNEDQDNSFLQLLTRKHERLKEAKISRTGLLRMVCASALRLSFSVEILSFCVRAHCYRMKRYLINSRVLLSVIKLLSPRSKTAVPSADRCLKLNALRCLRSILSLKDEFYNRHIIQHNLFTPVFEAFRANPVGDNLVSSSIIEICEFIRTENVKSLIEYIVKKHLCPQTTQPPSSLTTGDSLIKLPPSLEDVATPYVDTLTLLREKYEENIRISHGEIADITNDAYKGRKVGMSDKAMEDQRKFRETDEEESYFFDDVEDNREVMSYNPELRHNGIRQGYRL